MCLELSPYLHVGVLKKINDNLISKTENVIYPLPFVNTVNTDEASAPVAAIMECVWSYRSVSRELVLLSRGVIVHCS